MNELIETKIMLKKEYLDSIKSLGYNLDEIINNALSCYLEGIKYSSQPLTIKQLDEIQSDVEKYVSGLIQRYNWIHQIEQDSDDNEK